MAQLIQVNLNNHGHLHGQGFFFPFCETNGETQAVQVNDVCTNSSTRKVLSEFFGIPSVQTN